MEDAKPKLVLFTEFLTPPYGEGYKNLTYNLFKEAPVKHKVMRCYSTLFSELAWLNRLLDSKERREPSALYRDWLSLIGKPPHECTQQQATSWCEGLAKTVPEALRRICGSYSHESIEDEFPDVLSRARQRVDACPVEMGGAANLDILYRLAEACAVPL